MGLRHGTGLALLSPTMKIKLILAAVDFSDCSLEALRYAADLSRALRSRLEIVHVVEAISYAPMVGSGVDLDRVRELQEGAAWQRLEQLAADLRKRGLRCRIHLKVGAAASTIVDTAQRRFADLIVVATAARRGVGRLLLGSVAERVVQTSTCPVLAIAAGSRKKRTPLREAGVKVRRILAPTDFSEISDHAVRDAAGLARRLGAELILLHAVEPLLLAGDLDGSSAVATVLTSIEDGARKSLARRLQRLKKAGLRCRSVHATGMAATTIADAADKLRADLVVMATHGRTGVSHLFLGSVAERVVRTAHRPVLTVPAPRTAVQAQRPRAA